MGYYEFTITHQFESRDAVIEKLSEMGSLGMIETDTSLIAYFPDVPGIESIRAGVDAGIEELKEWGLADGLSYDYSFISERDWNESWKKKFQPVDVGENLSVIPPWEEARPDRVNLVIDPGMAFGTGHHETTKTCLMLIERCSKEGIKRPLSPLGVRGGAKDCFLDIGTGTGILAIAASKLGYRRVVGVDVDPPAVDAASRNVALNDLANVEIREGTVTDVDKSYDLIVANLLSEILIRLAHEIAARLRAPGVVILSGIIDGQEGEVIAAMEREGLRLGEKVVDGRWVTIVFTR